MYSTAWKEKRDPILHPTRFLEGLWQSKLREKWEWSCPAFNGKEYGQMRNLQKAQGGLAAYLVEWVVEPVNWHLFCQRVPAELNIQLRLPKYPHIGFLSKYQGIALNLMHALVQDDPEWAGFVSKVESRKYQDAKNLAKVLASGSPPKLEKIESAKTFTQMQAVLNELLGEDTDKAAA